MFANKLLSIPDINEYMTGIFVYKWIHKDVCDIFQNLFLTNGDFHNYDTRHSDDLSTPSGRLEVRKCSIKIHGVHVWNSIPDYVKTSTSIVIFKRRLRSFLIDRRLSSSQI